MLIDTHAHINFRAFEEDRHETIKRTLESGVWMINIGSQNTTSQRAVEIAEKYKEGVYACVGLHPVHLAETVIDEAEVGVHFASREEEFSYEFYRNLARSPKVVGIGECGLEYYHLSSKSSIDNQQEDSRRLTDLRAKQKQVFITHIKLADEIGLPLALHCRGSKENPQDAYWEMLEILKKHQGLSVRGGPKVFRTTKKSRQSNGSSRSPYGSLARIDIRGVIHCFGSTLEIAKQFIDLGFYIGFTGIITFPNAERLREIVSKVPLERVLIETDCPYLAPQPARGKRNEPLFVKYVAEKIAEIKKLPVREVEKITFENALRVFKRITL